MKDAVRNGLVVGSYLLGVPAAAAAARRRRGRAGTRIVTFHKIYDASFFERQLKQIAAGHALVSLADFLDGQAPADRASAVITFDDGYRSWLDALPVLRRMNAPATFFVNSGLLDADTPEALQAYYATRLTKMRPAPSLGWDGLREIVASGPLFDVGGHTVRHISMGQTGDPGVLDREVRDDKRRIEEMIGRPIRTFAYPFGDPSAFGPAAARAARAAGYDCALTLIPGFNDASTPRFYLRRDCADGLGDGLLLRSWLAGGFDAVKAVQLRLFDRSEGARALSRAEAP